MRKSWHIYADLELPRLIASMLHIRSFVPAQPSVDSKRRKVLTSAAVIIILISTTACSLLDLKRRTSGAPVVGLEPASTSAANVSRENPPNNVTATQPVAKTKPANEDRWATKWSTTARNNGNSSSQQIPVKRAHGDVISHRIELESGPAPEHETAGTQIPTVKLKPAGPIIEPPPTEAPAIATPTTEQDPPLIPKPAVQPLRIKPSYRAQSIEKGSRAYAIEDVQCLFPKEVWATIYEGTLEDYGPDSSSVRLTTRYGVRYDPSKFGESSESWACVPKRRICYSKVGFADWAGKRKAGELVVFDNGKIHAASHKLLFVADLIARSECGY